MAAGIASRFGIDVSLVRLAFVVATAAGGFGLGAYLLAWILIPSGEPGSDRSRLPTGRAAVEVALGTGLLLIAALLTFRALGIWFSDAVAWPLVLIAERRRTPLAPVARRPRARGGGAAHARGGQRGAAQAGRTRGREPPRGGRHLADRPRRGARDRGGVRLPPGHRRPGRGARRAARGDRRRGGARRDLRSLDRAAGALAHPGARPAHPLAGARRDGRSPARLGPSDARHGAAQRRRPRRGGRDRAPPGARAARVAGRQARARAGRAACRGARGGRRRRGGALRGSGRGGGGRRPRARRQSRGDGRGRTRGDDERGEVRRRLARWTCTPRATPAARRCSSAIAGRASTPSAVPGDRRGVRDSIVGRMERHGGRARVANAPGGGTEVELVLEERQ